MRLHRRQFVIGPSPLLADEGWVTREIQGGCWLSHSPALPIADTRYGLLLGTAVGDEPDEWAGRWVLITGTTLTLDACGLLGVFYRNEWLSSSPALLRLLPPELSLPRERLVYESGMDWFPPPASGIPGIRRLMPSQTIDVATAAIAPRPLLTQRPPAAAHQLADELVAILRRLRASHRRAVVPLTGGRDSRLVLAAALAAGLDVITYTAVRPAMQPGDVTLPPRLAAIAGVPHYAVRGGQVRDELVEMFDLHCAHHCVDRARTGIAAADIPVFDGALHLSGVVFELGRLYYHGLPETLDDTALERKPAREWADWIQKHPEPLDWRDRFYWEQRLGGWASSNAQASDISPPDRFYSANSRRFVTGLLAFPERARRRGAPQQEMLTRLSPELAAVPINPQPGSPVIRRIRREAHLLRRDGRRYLARRIDAVRG